MKRNLQIMAALSAWVTALCTASAQNICIETGPHFGAWQCFVGGSINNSGSLTFNTMGVCVGQPVSPPVLATTPTFNDGQRRRYVSFDCPENSNYWEAKTVRYIPGFLYFDPAIPSTFATPGQYTFTAKVEARPTSLISWWPGNGNTTDIFGGRNGTLGGNATYGAGLVNNGFVLDGNFDGISVANHSDFQLQDFTIEAWIKRSSTTKCTQQAGQTTAVIFSYGYGGYGLGMWDNGNLFLSKIGISAVTVSTGIADTSWHHVAVTKTGSTVIFYVDGVAYTAAAYNPGFVFNTGLAIGARGDGLSGSFYGSIDEVSVYYCALSAAQIQAIYNASSAGKCWTGSPAECSALPTGCICSPVTATVGTLVITVNDPQAVSLSSATLTHVRGSGPSIIDSTAAFPGVWNGAGTVTVQFGGGSTVAGDRFSVRNEGPAAGQIGVSGTTITYGGSTIATISSGNNGSPLLVTLNSSTTDDALNALLRNLTYEFDTTSPCRPNTVERTLEISIANASWGCASPPASKPVKVICQALDVMIVFDKSGSMSPTYPPSQGGNPNRLSNARNGAEEFVHLLNLEGGTNPDRAGLVTFCGSSSLNQSLTSGAGEQTLISKIRNIGPNNEPGADINLCGDTHIASGMDTARVNLPVSSNKRVIVLLTDGRPTVPTPTSAAILAAKNAASTAKTAGIHVITIGVELGTGNAADQARDTLEYMASPKPNGTGPDDKDFYEATDSGTLGQIYAAIVDSLCPPVNDAPVVSLGAPVTYSAGAGPLIIASAATVVDPNETTEKVVIVENAENADPNDRLTIEELPGGFTITGNDLYSGVAHLGTITGGGNGSDPLIVNFWGSIPQVQTLVQSIGFRSVSASPPLTDRKIRVTVREVDCADSQPAEKIVHVTNLMPLFVSAGVEQRICYPSQAALNGLVTGGKSPVTIEGWSQVTGPGTVTFSEDPNFPGDITKRKASFSAPGIYQLRLSAFDADNVPRDDSVLVYALPSESLAVNAGPDRVIGLGTMANLAGFVSDGHSPLRPCLDVTWTLTSSPPGSSGPIADDRKATTTAGPLTVAGNYVFTLTAQDGTTSSSDTMTVTVVGDLRARTFTKNVDFEQGSLMNLNYDQVPDQLQLNTQDALFSYVYIACSARNTVAKIDVNTGHVVGEYRTRSDANTTGGNPSRTTVDKFGNVWVANRGENGVQDPYWWVTPSGDGSGMGSIARIGLVLGGTRVDADGEPNPDGDYLSPPFLYNTCADRDGDGLIKTSRGLGSILPWQFRDRGRLIVHHDAAAFSDSHLLQDSPDGGQTFPGEILARNIRDWFRIDPQTQNPSGQTVRFLVYSADSGLTGSDLANLMDPPGSSQVEWIVDSSGQTLFTVDNLAQYDALFLAGPVNGQIPDNEVVIEYLKSGKKVYVAGNSAYPAMWNTLLAAFGLRFDPDGTASGPRDVSNPGRFPLPNLGGAYQLFYGQGNLVRLTADAPAIGGARIVEPVNAVNPQDGLLALYFAPGTAADADDEAIINYTRVPGTGVRTVAVDDNNDVWTGGVGGEHVHQKVDGKTGTPVGSIVGVGLGGYGGLIGKNGVLWSVDGYGVGGLLRYEPLTSISTSLLSPDYQPYGIGMDPVTGNIWYAVQGTTPGGQVVVVNPTDGSKIGTYPHGDYSGRGICVDRSGNVWVAHSAANGTVYSATITVGHLRTDGTFVGNVQLPCDGGATGVSVDSNGKIWVANGADNAMRIDPNLGEIGGGGFRIGAVDMVVRLGEGAGPYNYSDMTGSIAVNKTTPWGIWSVIHDSGQAGTDWGTATWTTELNGGSIVVEVRADDEPALLPSRNFTAINNGASFANVKGRHIEIRATLTQGTTAANNPVLKDLTITPAGAGTVIQDNAPSLAVDDAKETSRNSINVSLNVLENDIVPHGRQLRIVGHSSAHFGSVSIDPYARAIIYSPYKDFVGEDRFTYTVSDGLNGVGRAMVKVNVRDTDTTAEVQPVARDDEFNVVGTIAGTYGPNVIDVLNNDITLRRGSTATTLEQTTRIIEVGKARSGATVLPDQCADVVWYTPSPGFSGEDEFTYTIQDVQGLTSTAKVRVTVMLPDAISACSFSASESLSSSSPISSSGDELRSRKRYANTFEFTPSIARYVTINLSSADFDPRLYLKDSAGNIVADTSSVSGSANVSLANVPLIAGKTYTVEVTSVPPSAGTPPPTGDYDVTLTCVDAPPQLQVSFSLPEQVISHGGSLYLGGVVQDTSLLNTPITLKNVGGSPLNISSVNVANIGFSMDAFSAATLNPGDSTTVNVRFDRSLPPNPPDNYYGDFTVSCNDPLLSSGFSMGIHVAVISAPQGTFAITSPLSGASFVDGTAISLRAEASGGAIVEPWSVSFLDVFGNTATPIETVQQSPSDGSYSVTLFEAALGTHTIIATATLTDGATPPATPVYWVVRSAIQVNVTPVVIDRKPPDAVNDVAYMIGSLPPPAPPNTVVIPVLPNDSSGYPGDNTVTIEIDDFQAETVFGDVEQVGQTLRYTPSPLGYGTDSFWYTIRNSKGATDKAWVTVNVAKPDYPTVSITSPVSGATIGGASVTFNVNAAAQTPGAVIAKVEYFSGDQKIGESTSSPFSYTWTKLPGGDYLITAVATDTLGLVGYSSPIVIHRTINTTHIPTARIANSELQASEATLPGGGSPPDRAAQYHWPILRLGRLDLIGAAADSTVTPSWQLLLRRENGDIAANLTPTPHDSDGYRQSTVGGVTAGNNGSLATLDLSTFENGTYAIELIVWNGDNVSRDVKPFVLQTDLKIGRFTFSQEDLVIPVSGMPLTVVRTYDSFNSRCADFGYGWTYAINDVNLEINEERMEFDDLETGERFSMRVGGGRDVTLTLPDGRRTTFTYINAPGPCDGGACFAYSAKWVAEPGVTATLTTLSPAVDASGGDNTIYWVDGWDPYWQLAGYAPATENFDPMQAFDPAGFLLTLDDGTKLRFDREDLDSHEVEVAPGEILDVHAYGKARLTSITQRDGSRTFVLEDRIEHYNPDEFTPTRSVIFAREHGRIVAIYDPSSITDGVVTGPAAVKYIYDSKTNLVNVLRLTDKSNPAAPRYEDITYVYNKLGYPHHITEIKDSRGIAPIVNEYDTSGRLSAVVDAQNKRTEFIHDSPAPAGGFKGPNAVGMEVTRVKPITDQSKFTDTFNEFDVHGNVVASYSRFNEDAATVFRSLITRKYNTAEAYPTAPLEPYNNLIREETVYLDSNADPMVQRTMYERTYFGDGKVESEQTTRRPIELKSVDPSSPTPDDIVQTTLYDQFGQVLASVDAKGYVTANDYDSGTGQLLKTYHYISYSLYQSDPDRTMGTLLTENSYNASGQLEWTKDAIGNKTVNIYYTTETPDGRSGDLRSVENYDANELLLSRVTYTCDANGNQKTEAHFKDASTNPSPVPIVTQYQYDTQNRLVRTIDPLNGVSVTTYRNNLSIQTIDRYGATTINTYNTLGEVVQTETADHAITRTATRYDAQGQRQIIVERPHFDGDPVYGTRTTYDKLGRPILTEQLESVVISLVPQGLATEAQFVSATPIPSSTTQTHYDEAGRVDYTIDAKGYRTDFGYDAHNRRNKTINEVNGKTIEVVSEFDANGNKTSFYTVVDDIPQPADDRTDYEYDDYNRQIKITFPAVDVQGGFTPERLARHTFYDLLGRRTEEIDQDGVSTKYEYDGAGRLVAVINAYLIYDTTLNPIQPATSGNPPPDQTITRYKYDDLGNLIQQTDANQTVVTPVANQKHTTFEYDSLGRRTKRMLPEGQFETYTYDPVVESKLVRRSTRTDFNSASPKVTTFDFDEMGRLKTKTPHASFGASPVAFTYTATGQRETMTDGVGTTTYQFDNRNRLWKKITPVGTLTYTYDGNGNLTGIQSSNPNGVDLAYNHDVLNRLETANFRDDASNAVYGYDDFGNLDSFLYPNAVKTEYNYDKAHRLTDMSITELSLTPKTLATFDYNPTSRRLSKTGQRRTAAETIKTVNDIFRVNRQVDYEYDPLHRLTKEDVTLNTVSPPLVGPIVYDNTPGYAEVDGSGYDRVGNRRKRTVNTALETALAGKLPTRTYLYNANDWLTGGNGGTTTTDPFTGNTLRGELTPGFSGDDQTADDVYDFENRLVRRTSTSGIYDIVYDGDGNRVKKIVKDTGGNVTKVIFYLVSELNPSGYVQVMEEFESSTAAVPAEADRVIKRRYAYGHDLLFQERKSASIWLRDYYGYDGHGNVRFLFSQGVDGAATITDTYTYDAFGTLIDDWHLAGAGNATPNNYLYCGEQWDSDLGMYFLRARYLNPNTGRFWTMDTFEGSQSDPLSLHKYLYAHGNPVNYIDPSGRMTTSELLATTGIIATIAATCSGTIAAGVNSIFHGWPDAFTVGWYAAGSLEAGKAGFGGIGGPALTFYPRLKQIDVQWWGGLEGTGEISDESKKHFPVHIELGFFGMWIWRGGPGGHHYHPLRPVLGGVDVRGLLYGIQVNDEEGSVGILTGVSYSPGGLGNISAFAIGSEWTIKGRLSNISEAEMVGYVAFFNTALGVLQGGKFESIRKLRDPRGIAIGSAVNAGFAALWVQQTYGKKP